MVSGEKGKVPIYSVHIHPDGSRLATGGIGTTANGEYDTDDFFQMAKYGYGPRRQSMILF